ncbi:MAG: DUF1080 domain-containing protein [Bacteroidetes bacterium]|nr:MAG: DUF1080 domain-containing protein [Bacteroidota bacterium]TAF96549.1 MAG: DUF1080 domain-containing protein [Bacteroidota bacterium]
MKKIFISALAASISLAGTAQKVNKSWQLLFNGKNTQGWHNYGKTTIGKGWKVENGTLHLDASAKNDWQSADGGDIVFEQEFTNFHLSLEWKIAKNGNSGIMFFVHEDTLQYKYPWMTGPEMQVLDNNGHPDAKIFKHRAGDLYDLIPCSKETVKPAGQWNHAEVICNKGVLTFKLNRTVVVTTTLWDAAWKKLVAESKFNAYPGFGIYQKGKIALQDHGDDVWYRNIKVRQL